ncbi:hypothetical protein BLNAU_875 [Blattamonas nauphoetae]|uniref:Cytochrome C biogenesis protein transmembrane domain-containing protein n=1 Tax=Blattamonas nauphoetae TaxID=2049346 RepID=A0ABQ9YKR3_9EUKA|nr:hypothetical protein BLNAU_875 [Blattamonas nauphoetae]
MNLKDIVFPYSAGLSAAVSPCVIVLMPMLLVRFNEMGNRKLVGVPLLVAGFICTFCLLGFFISELMESQYQSGVRLGLGLLFATLGIQSFLGKVSSVTYPLFKNPFLIGGVYAVLVSYNPCTIPYLGMLVSIAAGPKLVLTLLIFSLGMITPSIIFSLFGDGILTCIQTKMSGIMHWFNKLMALVNVGTGAYLAWSIHSLSIPDIAVATVMLAVSFFLIFRNYFDGKMLTKKAETDDEKKEKKRSWAVIFIFAVLIGIAVTLAYFSREKKDEWFQSAEEKELMELSREHSGEEDDEETVEGDEADEKEEIEEDDEPRDKSSEPDDDDILSQLDGDDSQPISTTLPCKVMPPCPECKFTVVTYLVCVVLGFVASWGLAVKKETFQGVVDDVCMLPKFQKPAPEVKKEKTKKESSRSRTPAQPPRDKSN